MLHIKLERKFIKYVVVKLGQYIFLELAQESCLESDGTIRFLFFHHRIFVGLWNVKLENCRWHYIHKLKFISKDIDDPWLIYIRFAFWDREHTTFQIVFVSWLIFETAVCIFNKMLMQLYPTVLTFFYVLSPLCLRDTLLINWLHITT